MPVSGAHARKVTVVKSSDGRIIVKASESVENESTTKTLTTSASVVTPSKPVVISSVKPLSSPVSSTSKSEEQKKEETAPPKGNPSKSVPASPSTKSVEEKRDESLASKSTPAKEIKKVGMKCNQLQLFIYCNVKKFSFASSDYPECDTEGVTLN